MNSHIANVTSTLHIILLKDIIQGEKEDGHNKYSTTKNKHYSLYT